MGDATPAPEGASPSPPPPPGSAAEDDAGTVPYVALFRHADARDMGMIAIGVLAALASGVIMPFFALLFGDVVNAVAEQEVGETGAAVTELALAFLYLAAVGFVLQLVAFGFLKAVSEGLAGKLRVAYFTALLAQDLAWHDVAGRPGELAARLAGDVDAIAKGTGVKLAEALSSAATFIVGLAVALSADAAAWELVLLLLGCMPVLLVGMACMASSAGALTARMTQLTAAASGVLTEAVAHIRSVLAAGAAGVEVARYTSALEEAASVNVAAGRLYAGTIGLSVWALFTTYGIGLFYGATLIARNREEHPECDADATGAACLTGGTVLTVFFGVVLGGSALGSLAPAISVIYAARATAHKLFAVLDAPPGMPPGGTQLPQLAGALSLQDVTFAYPSRPAAPVLRGLSLDIPAGARVALVGPSGSGKSTVAALLQRLYDVQGGAVKVDGVDVRTLDVHWWRAQCAVVGQQPALFAGSVGDNIRACAPDASDAAVQAAATVAAAHDFISALPDGYDTAVGTRGGQLSGGQRQRIAIARAVAAARPLLLLDEATSALDSASEAAVQAALDATLAAAVGRTSVTVAHRLSTVRDADVIFVLQDGVVAESGRHEALLEAGGLYAAMWRLQEVAAGTSAVEAVDVEGVAPEVPDAPQPATPPAAACSAAATAAEALKEVEEEGAAGDAALAAWKATLPPIPFSRVWALGAPERRRALAGYACAALAGTIMPLFALALSEIVALFFEVPGRDLAARALPWMLGFFAIALAGCVGNAGGLALLAETGEALVNRLRVAAFSALLRQEVAFFDAPENTPGRLAGRLAKDAKAVSALLGVNLATALQVAATLAVALAIAFAASWRVAAVMAVACPLLAAATAAHLGLSATLVASAAWDAREVTALAGEALGEMRTVASLGLQRTLLARFTAAAAKPTAAAVRLGYAAGVLTGVNTAVFMASYALGFYLGGIWIADGSVTFPALLQAFLAMTFAAQGVGQAATFTVASGEADAGLRSLFAIVDRKGAMEGAEELPVPAALASIPPGAPLALSLQDVTFAYPSRPAAPVLRGLSLDIPAGARVALVGPSGSGKSTVAALLQRLYDVQGGAVKVDGVDVRELQLPWLRARVGWLPQEPALFADSVAYNIGYGLPGPRPPPAVPLGQQAPADLPPVPAALSDAAKAAAAHDFIAGLSAGYATHVGAGGGQLSGGQRQRVALARCLARHPSVLLLDEPTSALDSGAEAAVQEAVQAAAASGATVVTVAHRLSTVRDADVIFVLQDGVVAESGRHEALLEAGGLYAAMVAAQAGAP